MDLILWRHAEAEERRPGLPDARRRLTPKGEKQARRMAKWLMKRLPKDTRILVSPTERTQMTAHALGLPFEIEESIGPDADARGMLKAISWPAGDGAVLVVGHQPTVGRIAALVLAGKEADWAIKKGAVWWLSPGDRNGEPASLRATLSPNDA